MGATDRLFDRHPDAQPWGIRIGHSAVYHFGSLSLNKNQRLQVDNVEGGIVKIEEL